MSRVARPALSALLLSTALVPLIAAPEHFVYPFVAPKVLWLRLVVALALPFLAVAWLQNARHTSRWRPSPIAAAVLSSLFAMAIATPLGVDPSRSLHDSQERMMGLVTHAHLAAWFLVALVVLRSRSMLRATLVAFAVAGVSVAAIAAYQKIDPDFLANRGSPRVGSTLGQPTDLGWFGGFVALLGVLLFQVSRARWQRALAVTASISGVAALLLSETRSALLGFLVAACMLLAAAGLRSQRRAARRAVLAGFSAILLAAALAGGLAWLEQRMNALAGEIDRHRAALLMRFLDDRRGESASDVGSWRLEIEAVRGSPPEKRTAFVADLDRYRSRTCPALDPIGEDWILHLDPALLVEENRALDPPADRELEERYARTRAAWQALLRIPGLRRFGRLAPLMETVKTRALKWQVALQAFRDRPLFGYGPCNFEYAYDRHYPPRALERGQQETWVDNAHSFPLQAMATGGLLGLLAELSLFAVPLLWLLAAWRRKRIDPAIAIWGVAYLAYHAVYLLLVFDSVSSRLGLLLALAIPAASASRGLKNPGEPPRSIGTRGLLLVATSLALAAASIDLTVREARDNTRLRAALGALGAGEMKRARAALESLGHGRTGPHAEDGVALAVSTVLEQLAAVAASARERGIPRERLHDHENVAALQAIAHHLFDRLAAARGETSRPRHILRRANLALQLDLLFGDPERLAQAEADLRAALPVHGSRQEIRFALGDILLVTGRPISEIEAVLEPAIAAAPRVGEAWLRLANAYRAQGQQDVARALAREALRQGARFRARERPILLSLLDAGT